jgi:hypothetical protein
MKKILIILFFIPVGLNALAQTPKDEKEIIKKTQLLSSTVFGTKDSATLDKLFAVALTYGHSGGAVQDRYEAIAGISKNKSVYTDTSLKSISVTFANKGTAVVRYVYDATENKADGTVVPLKFHMLLVWIYEGDWKLFVRQAIKRS